jgi:hypothetical protein
VYDRYGYVKQAYDTDVSFRVAVDNYLIPDGINLIVSRRLELLRELIEGFSGHGFNAFRARVRQFVAIGPAPAAGVLSGEEFNEVKGNRAWRELVDRKISDPAQRALIKADLWIAQ